jgi:uncharacterized protein (DUF1778 family)
MDSRGDSRNQRGSEGDEAHRVRPEVTTFKLDDAAWAELAERLEHPAKVPEALADLFAKPAVFE